MCIRILPALLVALISFSAFAQQTDSTGSKPSGFISLHSGLLFSDPGTPVFVSATLILGIRYDRLHLGVGAGYDAYAGWQTVPVFAALGWDALAFDKGAVYIQVRGGYAKAWNTHVREISNSIVDDGGYFAHPIIGYRMEAGKVNLYFSGGYKIQRLHYDLIPVWGAWGMTSMKTSVVRDMQRLSLQIGIGLN